MLAVHVSALVYSGREDPQWDLRGVQAAEFLERVNALPASSHDAHPSPGGLGYRGLEITVRSGAITKRYVVGEGTVVLQGSEAELQRSWRDRGQGLELWLLHTGAEDLGPDLLEFLLGSVGEHPRR